MLVGVVVFNSFLRGTLPLPLPHIVSVIRTAARIKQWEGKERLQTASLLAESGHIQTLFNCVLQITVLCM